MKKSNENSSIFLNTELQSAYSEKGYCVVKNFCNSEVVNKLLKLYQTNFDTKNGMYVTHTGNDFEKNKQVFQSIFEIIRPDLEKYFTNTQAVLAHFAVKNNKGNNAFLLHQDYNITDEEKHEIAHIWIALGKVSPYNGGMMIIPKSHKHYKTYRSGTFGVNFLPFEKMRNKAIGFDLEAGDAIFYHPSVFHGSKDNLSEKDRLAVIAAVYHKDAPMLYYQKTEKGADVYELTEKDLFSRLYDLAQGELPLGKFVESLAVENVSQEMIMNKIHEQ